MAASLLKKICFMAGLVLLSQVVVTFEAQAQSLQWKNIRAKGGGDGTPCFYRDGDWQNNMTVLDNGSTISFGFNTLGIYLFPSSRARAHSASCNVEATVTVPRGHYLANLSQTIAVGVLKSAGTKGGVSSNAFFFQNKIPLNQVNLEFSLGEQNDPLILKTNTQYFTEEQRKIQCAATLLRPLTTVFKFQVLATGSRPTVEHTFLTQVDGADLTLDIAPVLKSCRSLF